MIKKLSTIISICVISFVLLFSPQNSYAKAVTQSIYEFNLNPEEIKLGSFEYYNDNEKSLNIGVIPYSYNSQESQILKIDPLISVSQNEYTISPKGTAEIKYAISIPKDQPLGTYFNVLSIESQQEQNKTDDIAVNIKNGIGVLFVFNIIDTQSNIEAIFFEKSETQLLVENKGFPFIYPLKAKYIYKNGSNFVFKPDGEIRFLDSKGKQVNERYEINPDKEAIYPNETIEIELEVKTWDGLVNLLSNREVIAHTYSGLGKDFVEDKAVVNIQFPIYLVGGVSAILLITLLLTVLKIAAKRLFKKD